MIQMRRTTKLSPSKNKLRKSREKRMPVKFLDLPLLVYKGLVMEPMLQANHLAYLRREYKCQSQTRAKFQHLTWV
jgi:hypothetical protein